MTIIKDVIVSTNIKNNTSNDAKNIYQKIANTSNESNLFQTK